jgi:hypothetical protein
LLSGCGTSHAARVRLGDAARVVQERLPPDTRSRLLCTVHDDPTPYLTDRYPRFAERAPKFDAIVEIESASVPLSELIAPLAALRSGLDGSIDPTTSGAIAGVEHTIVAGEAPLMLVYPIRRAPWLSPEAFWERWFRGHVEVASEAGNLGKFRYRQFHASPDPTAAAAEAAGVMLCDFDGAAIGFYDDLDQFIRVAVDPAMRIDDELHFIDHSRSAMGMYEQV